MLLCLCVVSLHVLVCFVDDVLCDAVSGVCHCVWFFCLECLCVLFVVYCDVLRFVMWLRVLLCVCVCVCLGALCVCVCLLEAYRVMLYGVFVCGVLFFVCCSCWCVCVLCGLLRDGVWFVFCV